MGRIIKLAQTLIVAGALVIIVSHAIDSQAEIAQAAATKEWWVGPGEFAPQSDSNTWLNSGTALLGNGTFVARAAMPAGKKLVGIKIYTFDTMSPEDICVALDVAHAGTHTTVNLISAVCSSAHASGFGAATATFPEYKLAKNDLVYVRLYSNTMSFTLYMESAAILYK